MESESTAELVNFQKEKRKSKRRSSIASCDAFKIMNNQKDCELMNQYDALDKICDSQFEWLNTNYAVIESYSNMSRELANQMNGQHETTVCADILSDEQKLFLSRHSVNEEFIDNMVKKYEVITIKCEAMTANLRAKEFERSKLADKTNQGNKRLPIATLAKKHDDPVKFLREYINS